MEVKNYPKYEDLPADWVPIPPTNMNWPLDHAASIHIKRRGFALSPDFSSTIHSATGRTLVSCVPDLNPIEVAPNAQSAMEGYIALSRVEDAEGLIIAQPFAPTLFQQGPAPYPTLLLEVLKGQVSQLDLDKRLSELEATNTTKLLKQADFRCGSCDKDLPASRFIRPSQSSEAYVQSIINKILMSGACAVCMRCRVGIDEQMCFLCEEIKETKEFVKRVHYSDEWRCLACAHPPCSNSECNYQKTTDKAAPLPSHLWPKTKEELANFRCLACREKLECWVCHKLQPQTNFSAGELKQKYTQWHKSMCLDCMHPPCSNPRCQTCKSCRNPKCTEITTCNKEPEALLGTALSMLKNTKLCSACRKTTLGCRATDCTRCSECEKMVSTDWTNRSS